MKKISAILLSLIIIFSIVGCSSKKTPSSDNTQKASSDSAQVSSEEATPKSESSTDSSGQSATKSSNSSDNTQNSASESTTVSPVDSTPKSELSSESSGQSATKSSNSPDNTQNSASESTTVSPVDSTPKSESSTDSSGQSAAKSSNILVAYFTMPEDVNTAGVDAIASASIVVKDGKALGNTQYMAQVIQQTAGGDLFSIETVQQYPLDHDPLVDQAAAEQKNNARPKLATHVENMENYDVIFLGYPNWWGDLPMPLYTFLEEYDLSGKTIIPFCPHGGSGFSRTVSTIAEMQPKATVSNEGLTVSRNNVAYSEADVKAWLKDMGMLK